MPEHADEGPQPRRPAGAARRTEAGDSKRSQAKKPPPRASPTCLECELQDGLPIVRGKAQAHYHSGEKGQRMLVFERRPGERIRINATTEIVILDIGDSLVQVAIETVSDAAES